MSLDQMLQDAQEPAAPAAAPRAGRRALAVGGAPRVSLLPREVRARARQRVVERGIVAAVLAVVVLVAGGVGLASVAASAAQQRQADATARLTGLQTQLARFRDVAALQQRIALGTAAVRVGSSTAVDWQAQLAAVQASEPAGFTTTAVTTDAATPLAPYAQSSSPIEGPRVGTIVLTATTASIDDLPAWLKALQGLPSYRDASPVVTGDGDQGYTVVLTIHLNKKAFTVQDGAAR